MALLMLAAAVWTAQNPERLIEIFRGLQYELQSECSLRDDRCTRAGVRLAGVLMALVATMHLYMETAWMLARLAR